MINVDDLLKPIAEGKPCGEDFTYDPSFQSLETLSLGKPETQFGPGEEPQWKEVREAALDVLRQSKHLAAGVILTVSLLKTGGLEGYRDGLAFVHGLIEKYWGDLYPKLDPEDNNDPTQRLNILSQLSSSGKPYQVTLHLKQIVLCSSQNMGRITLQQFLTAKEKGGKTTPAPGSAAGTAQPDMNQINAAFQEAGPDAAKATFTLVNDAIGHAKGIEKFLDATLGVGNGVNFESLHKLLADMKQAVEPHATGGAPAGDAPGGDALSAAGGEGGSQSAAKKNPGVSGTVQTRADVVKALDLICDYYRDHEPSSPVPLILQRAQRLVEKDFMAIMTDLNPDAVRQLQVITGTKPKE